MLSLCVCAPRTQFGFAPHSIQKGEQIIANIVFNVDITASSTWELVGKFVLLILKVLTHWEQGNATQINNVDMKMIRQQIFSIHTTRNTNTLQKFTQRIKFGALSVNLLFLELFCFENWSGFLRHISVMGALKCNPTSKIH